jgi:hypothetical protein
LDKVFARLREAVKQHVPEPQYFSVDVRVASRTALRPPDSPALPENSTKQRMTT